MKIKTAGRPPNIYGMSPSDFETHFNALTKFKKVGEALNEPGFGAVGYMLSEKSKQHMARLILRPVDTSTMFFWFRVETPDGSVGWSCPSLVALKDVDELIERWEFDVGTQWTEGSPGSPFFPAEWKVPMEFVSSKKTFLVLSYEQANNHIILTSRGGIHTMSANKPGGRSFCAGIVGEDTHLELLRAASRMRMDLSTLNFSTPSLSKDVLLFLRYASALYTKERILEAGAGAAHGVVPHSAAINLPITTVRRFEP